MKKSILLLGVAVAAMTSCSNDKLLDQAEPIQRAIGFESWINKPTKAVNDITVNNLKEFNVFGHYTKDNAVTTVFTNTPVLYNAGEWNVTEQVLWTNNAYAFAAYAYGSGNSTNDAIDQLNEIEFNDDGSLTITNFSLGEDKDLIAGFATVGAINADAIDQRDDVEIDFKHLLSKVSFKFNYVEDNGIKVKITDISLNVPKTSTCTANINETTWNSGSNLQTYDFSSTDIAKFSAISYGTASDYSDEFYVIPDNANDVIADAAVLQFTATYTDVNGAVVRQKTYTLKLNEGKVKDDDDDVDYKWEPNNVYAYIVNLPFSPLYIDFTLGEITDWAEPTNIVNISPEDTSLTSETGE